MKKIMLLTVVAILVSLLLFPMPHGGTIGSNLVEGFVYEVRTYFSHKAKEARKKEDIERQLQKEEVRKSLEKFEKQNPQFFPK